MERFLRGILPRAVRQEMMDRNGISIKARGRAERLVAFEAAIIPPKRDLFVTCRVCEKLRRPLTTLIGPAGYSSLLSRALTLARRESPALAEVRVNPDGSLEGLEGEAAKVTAVLIAHVLALLTVFIGEALTMQFVRDIWPDFPGSIQAEDSK